MNILLEEATAEVDAAARKAQELRRQYNAAVADYKAKKDRWAKLSEAQMMADWELAQLRQRASR